MNEKPTNEEIIRIDEDGVVHATEKSLKSLPYRKKPNKVLMDLITKETNKDAVAIMTLRPTLEQMRDILDKYESRLYHCVESMFTQAGESDVTAMAWPKALERIAMRDAILRDHGFSKTGSPTGPSDG